MKNSFKKIVMIMAMPMIFAACNNTESGKSEIESNAKQEVALPQSGKADNNVFYATGEVVVFFEPSLERAKEMETEGGSEVALQRKAFQKANAEYIDQIEAMGIKAYKSREKNIKINVSESQYYVVNTAGVKVGYGVAMAKLNDKPKVIQGIPSWEELEKEIKAYYKK